MDESAPLEAEIRRRIQASGPMPFCEYMALCLTDPDHGYYTTRDPLGEQGDFITAPEVSQIFGELIGLWMAAVWKQMGAPENLRIVELGPGRGTLMSDAMRTTHVMPGFRESVVLHLIEINPFLEAQQERALGHLGIPMSWHPAFDDVPGGPSIIIANEFFDALPVNQAVKTAHGWHERQVDIDSVGNLVFSFARDPIPLFDGLLPAALRGAPEQSIFEWRSDTMAMRLGRRIAGQGGAALVIDYGHAESDIGDTLQAVGRHAFADPLTAPGLIDLTAHVDFQALARAVESMGTDSHGPIDQSLFLRRLGIETRAAALKAKATPAKSAEVDLAVARLIGHGRTAMGALFKAAAFTHPKLGRPPGFG
jgi:SAM-dependent MidA family methyltransferase